MKVKLTQQKRYAFNAKTTARKNKLLKNLSAYWQNIPQNIINFAKNKQLKSRHKTSKFTTNRFSRQETTKSKSNNNLLKIIQFLFLFIFSPLILFFNLNKNLFKTVFKFFSYRTNALLSIFTVLFVLSSFRLTQLQSNLAILGVNNNAIKNSSGELIVARRGQILMRDISQNKDNLPLTNTEVETDIFIDAYNLRSMVSKGMNFTLAMTELASRINLPYDEINKKVFEEINKESPNKHFVLAKDISNDQRQNLEFIKTSDINREYNFQYWLGLTEKLKRSYTENKLLAATIGYSPSYFASPEDISNTLKDCQKMVVDNLARGTENLEYMIGVYGIEQKYCSELGGLNGKRYFGATNGDQNTPVQNGADIYLTIDKNLQKKAEEVLEKAVAQTTNAKGGPKDGTAIILDPKTGKILAMASYPSFDPNNYQKAWNDSPTAFRNVATSVDYEVGSVIKPLTVAASLNAYEANTQVNGDRKGVNADFKFKDYTKGKVYQELNGKTLTISNADGRVFGGNLSLKEIIRDSINTGISDIVDKTGQTVIKDYFTQKYEFGQDTKVNLPGDENGNITRFEKDFNCDFCYATFGFGQGFFVSPLQLMRAYTVFANEGSLVEPYLVDSIRYKDGRIDDGTNISSSIYKEKSKKILTSGVTKNVLGYMRAVIEEGFLGLETPNAKVPGYDCAGKTGTAEIATSVPIFDSQNKPVLNDKGNQTYEFCDYECNRKKGLYDNTFVGMCPSSNPQLMILVKLSQSNPGVVRNYAGSTVGKPFSELMSYSLGYLGIPKS